VTKQIVQKVDKTIAVQAVGKCDKCRRIFRCFFPSPDAVKDSFVCAEKDGGNSCGGTVEVYYIGRAFQVKIPAAYWPRDSVDEYVEYTVVDIEHKSDSHLIWASIEHQAAWQSDPKNMLGPIVETDTSVTLICRYRYTLDDALLVRYTLADFRTVS
jgi:hypothetical protein